MRESFSDYQWDDRRRPPAIQLPHGRPYMYQREQSREAVKLANRTRRICSVDKGEECLWIKPPGVHTPTCATKRGGSSVRAHGLKSTRNKVVGLWNVLNVIHGTVSGRRYVNQPRWVQSDPRTARDDSCVPGIPNFVDYNYKSATLMLMSLSSVPGRVAAFGWLGSGRVEERRARDSENARARISRPPIRPRYATSQVTSDIVSRDVVFSNCVFELLLIVVPEYLVVG